MPLKTLGGYEDIFYATLVNKLLWKQGVYQTFDNEVNEATRNEIMVKGSIIAKQQNFGVINFKTMNLEINFTQREVPQVDEKESNKRPWECITHVLAAKDDALPQFGISNKVNRNKQTKIKQEGKSKRKGRKKKCYEK